MATIRVELPLSEIKTVADLRVTLMGRVPENAKIDVKTESRGGQFDQPPYRDVPTALVFTWER